MNKKEVNVDNLLKNSTVRRFKAGLNKTVLWITEKFGNTEKNLDKKNDYIIDADMRKFLTMKEACYILSVSERTLFQWIKEGKFPAYKTPGNHYRIDEEELEKWIRKQKVNNKKNNNNKEE